MMAAKTTTVTVAKGNTLSAIAKANNTTVAAIQKANPTITNANVINVGQKIVIPATTTAAKPATTTVAKPSVNTSTAAGVASASNPNNISYTPTATGGTTSFMGPIPTGATRTATGYVAADGTVVNPNGIAAPRTAVSSKTNPDGTVTTVYSDGTSETTGTPNKTITSTKDNGNGTYTVFYSDGTSELLGTPNKTIVGSVTNADGTTTVTYSDGSTQTIGTPTQPTITPGGGGNSSALQIITDALTAAGLGSLASKAWTMWNQGFDINAIMDDPINGIRAQPVYKQNFPAMAALNAAGQGITEAAYLAKEQADIQLLKQFGIPSGVFDTKDYLGSLMTNNVTTQDLQSRLQAVADTVNSFDPSVKQYALDTYGLDAGHLAAWALDPTKALPVIQQQANAVQIGGAALMTGFAGGLGANGELSTAQSEALAGAGVTQSQAQTGFNNIGQQGQFAQALPGDVSGNVSNQQLINAQFGMNPNDVIALKKVQQARINEFNAGGAVVGNAAGLSGLGTSNATA